MTVDDGSDDVDRILVVTAHPDDVDFGAAGSVATWTGSGDRRLLLHRHRRRRRRVRPLDHPGRDGRHPPRGAAGGGPGRGRHRRDLPRVPRRAGHRRPRAAGRHLPGDPARPSRPGRRPVARAQLGRASTPAIPTTWPPGEAAACAVYPDARNPFAFPELLEEGLEPHTVPELWVMATERANRVVDATDVYDRKLTALKSHRQPGRATASTSTSCCGAGWPEPRSPPACPRVGWPRPSTW